MLYHFIKETFALDEIIRSAFLGYFTSLHNYNNIVVNNGGEAVSYCDNSGVSESFSDNCLYESISLDIYVGSCFIQNQKFVFAQKSPC